MTEKQVYSFNIRARGGGIKNLPPETYARPSDSCADIYERIGAKARISVNRLRITRASDGAVVENDKTLKVDDAGLYEGNELLVKDLGPQISWRTVFIIEYLGPLLVHPLFYFALRSVIYKNPNKPGPFPEPSASLTLSTWMLTLHFLKREIETVAVHRFSNATMPATNIFKNSAHYWLLGGLNIAIWTSSPAEACPTSHEVSALWHYAALAFFVLGELGNFACHLTLMNLRSTGGRERGIPTGLFWNAIPVTCPNYFYEALAWVGIALANRSLSTVLFIVVAVGQMAVWAKKKERRYRKEFGDRYRKKRFAMIPGLF